MATANLPLSGEPLLFLEGGGEMGALTRAFDWRKTVLGAPQAWPQSLRTALSLLLNSRFPMFLFWGPELICFYNDAYRPSLGNEGKHPKALGQPGEECWPEIWPFIKPIIDGVMAGGEASWYEDQFLPIYRNGHLEDVYWTFSYSPVRDESGAVAGVFVTCTETTEKVTNLQKLAESEEQLRFAIDAAGLATWDYNPVTQKFIANHRLREWFGLPPSKETELTDAVNAIVARDRERVTAAIQQALDYSSGGQYDIEYSILNPKSGAERMVRARGRAWFGGDKVAYRLNGTLQDVTLERKAQADVLAAQQLADLAIKSAGIGLFRFDLRRGRNEYTPAFAQIMTGDATRSDLTRDDFRKSVHADSEQLRAAVADAAFKTGEFNYEPQVVWFDGSIHSVRIIGACVFDDAGKPAILSGTAQDITEQDKNIRARQVAEDRTTAIIAQAPVAIGLLDTREMIVSTANKTILDVWGKDASIIGQRLIDALPEIKDQPFIGLLESVYDTGEAFYGTGTHARLVRNGMPEDTYFDFVYTPMRDIDGAVTGVMVLATEVTDALIARKKLEDSERDFRNLVIKAPVGICIVSGSPLRAEIVNDDFLELVDRKRSEFEQKPYWEVLTEAEDYYGHILAGVMRTGVPHIGKETELMLIRNGREETVFIDYVYEPMKEADGAVKKVMVLAIEVTAEVLARRKVEESEQSLRSLVEAAPFPIGVYTGAEMRIQLANQSIIDVWGKGQDVIGKRYTDILPELQNQAIFSQLDAVYASGTAYHAKNQRVDIVVDGTLRSFYFNYSFTPLFDAEGSVYGVMNTAADVTDLVAAKQQVEEAEASLRSAIDLAELGTWTIDLAAGILDYSPRLREWFGFDKDELITAEKAYSGVREEYRSLVQESMQRAIAPHSTSLYDVEYPAVHKITGREKIIHAQGRAFFDADGIAYKVAGTVQDVTEQRRIQLALEQQVQERTEELQSLNEEMIATNETLEETNSRLSHSNEELAQYAYVASHDLQEPLRKIRMFSGMLDAGAELQPDQQILVQKIGQSSERMALLIKDLLDFSRLLKSETLMRPVALDAVMKAVTDDFELSITERCATVSIGSLPVIEAVHLQMNQLFFNLLSNALKFVAPAKAPRISVQSALITQDEARRYISKIFPYSTYFRITFSDNGIGFESKYAEQIFEVFKRLHGRDSYPGSGIGLALCRRIVANHGGHLYVASEPGEGSTFHLILPDRQHNAEAGLPENFTWQIN